MMPSGGANPAPLLDEFFTTIAEGESVKFCAICLKTDKETRLINSSALKSFVSCLVLNVDLKNDHLCFICHRQALQVMTFFHAVMFGLNIDTVLNEVVYQKKTLKKDVFESSVFKNILEKHGLGQLKASPQAWEEKLRAIRSANTLRCRRTQDTGAGTGRPHQERLSSNNIYVVEQELDERPPNPEGEVMATEGNASGTRAPSTFETETTLEDMSEHIRVSLASRKDARLPQGRAPISRNELTAAKAAPLDPRTVYKLGASDEEVRRAFERLLQHQAVVRGDEERAGSSRGFLRGDEEQAGPSRGFLRGDEDQAGPSRGFVRGDEDQAGPSRGFLRGDEEQAGPSRGFVRGDEDQAGPSRGFLRGDEDQAGPSRGFLRGDEEQAGSSRGFLRGDEDQAGPSRGFARGDLDQAGPSRTGQREGWRDMIKPGPSHASDRELGSMVQRGPSRAAHREVGSTIQPGPSHASDRELDSTIQLGLRCTSDREFQPGPSRAYDQELGSTIQPGHSRASDRELQPGLSRASDRELQPGLSRASDREVQPGLRRASDRGLSSKIHPGFRRASERELSSTIQPGLSRASDRELQPGLRRASDRELGSTIQPGLRRASDRELGSTIQQGLSRASDRELGRTIQPGLRRASDRELSSTIQPGPSSASDREFSSMVQRGPSRASDRELGSMIQPGLRRASDRGLSSTIQPGLSRASDRELQSGLSRASDRELQPGLRRASERELSSTIQPGLSRASDRELQPGLRRASDRELGSTIQPGLRRASDRELGSTIQPGLRRASDRELGSTIQPGLRRASDRELDSTIQPGLRRASDREFSSRIQPGLRRASDRELSSTIQPGLRHALGSIVQPGPSRTSDPEMKPAVRVYRRKSSCQPVGSRVAPGSHTVTSPMDDVTRDVLTVRTPQPGTNINLSLEDDGCSGLGIQIQSLILEDDPHLNRKTPQRNTSTAENVERRRKSLAENEEVNRKRRLEASSTSSTHSKKPRVLPIETRLQRSLEGTIPAGISSSMNPVHPNPYQCTTSTGPNPVLNLQTSNTYTMMTPQTPQGPSMVPPSHLQQGIAPMNRIRRSSTTPSDGRKTPNTIQIVGTQYVPSDPRMSTNTYFIRPQATAGLSPYARMTTPTTHAPTSYVIVNPTIAQEPRRTPTGGQVFTTAQSTAGLIPNPQMTPLTAQTITRYVRVTPTIERVQEPPGTHTGGGQVFTNVQNDPSEQRLTANSRRTRRSQSTAGPIPNPRMTPTHVVRTYSRVTPTSARYELGGGEVITYNQNIGDPNRDPRMTPLDAPSYVMVETTAQIHEPRRTNTSGGRASTSAQGAVQMQPVPGTSRAGTVVRNLPQPEIQDDIQTYTTFGELKK